jgi:hypothetical protein
MTNPDFAAKPTIVGAKVILRPFRFEPDAPALREMLTDPEVIRLTGSANDPGDVPAWDEAAETAFRDWYSTRNAQVDRLDLAVVDKASDQCVGEVVLNEWSEPSRSCNFRTIIGRRGWDRGLGTGHRGYPAVPRLWLRAAAPAPDRAGSAQLQPSGQAGLRQDRLRPGGRAPGRAPLGRPVD